MYQWDWSITLQYADVFIQGAGVTLWLTLLVVFFGTMLGILIGLLHRATDPFLRGIARLYIELFRALPILILLIWIYYVLPILLNIRLSPFISAFIALSMNLSAYVAETVRAGIEGIPRTQYESGITLGLNQAQIMFLIIFPQAFRSMLPNLLGLYITQLKNSSLASIIAVNELLHRSNSIISNTYRPLEIYTAVAILYLLMIIPTTLLVGLFEKRLAKKTKNT